MARLALTEMDRQIDIIEWKHGQFKETGKQTEAAAA
jgi:hypothetical protein